MSAIEQAKSALRRTMKARRLEHWRSLGEAGRRRAALAALASLGSLFVVGAAPQAIAGFWPLEGEFEMRPILSELSARGHEICLPVTAGANQPLRFRRWCPGDVLEVAGFGVSVPRAVAPVITPQTVLVPLLAFDGAGHRLGYGGGFYDRTLSALRATNPSLLAIGIAYKMQRVEQVPREEFDQSLDAILTEAGYVPAFCGT